MVRIIGFTESIRPSSYNVARHKLMSQLVPGLVMFTLRLKGGRA